MIVSFDLLTPVFLGIAIISVSVLILKDWLDKTDKWWITYVLAVVGILLIFLGTLRAATNRTPPSSAEVYLLMLIGILSLLGLLVLIGILALRSVYDCEDSLTFYPILLIGVILVVIGIVGIAGILIIISGHIV